MPVAARAQQAISPEPLRQLLGQVLPGQLRAVLPGEAFQAAEFVSSLMSLEAEAKVARLPPSRLATGEAPLPASLDSLYELRPAEAGRADRPGGGAQSGAGRQGGGLLARLHATQHAVPRWLASVRLPGAGEAEPMRLDPGSDEAAGLHVASPIELPAIDLPQIDLAARRDAAARRDEISPDLPSSPANTQHCLPVRDCGRSTAESASWHLAMMRQSRPRYERVAQRSGVPWFVIAAIHGLEASFNFRAHFHNGDFPLSSRTRQVPAGRPQVWLPPSDWEASAFDALRLLGFVGASDWSLPRTLYRLEAYNGFGYRRTWPGLALSVVFLQPL